MYQKICGEAEDYTFPLFKRYGKSFLRNRKIAGRIIAVCIIFPKYVYENVYVIICISLFTKEETEEQYLSHLHIAQYLEIEPRLSLLSTD